MDGKFKFSAIGLIFFLAIHAPMYSQEVYDIDKIVNENIHLTEQKRISCQNTKNLLYPVSGGMCAIGIYVIKNLSNKKNNYVDGVMEVVTALIQLSFGGACMVGGVTVSFLTYATCSNIPKTIDEKYKELQQDSNNNAESLKLLEEEIRHQYKQKKLQILCMKDNLNIY